MRKFNVNVNGKSYYVEVEEVASEGVATPAPAAAPVAAPKAAPVAAPKATAEAGSTVVTAPMPGTILNTCVENGATVNKGDKILVLEAMKMENEIVASASGKVTFLVKKGDSVDTGAQLAYIK
ncbi:MAG: acetyl-CoA carboxylase biotin carboxyl carrier protein subunit [Clostridia bacterium]|nr:acetyl-CoA carboxylase biotin carboxyl carrier protein subunit [Clostridia bacterium]